MFKRIFLGVLVIGVCNLIISTNANATQTVKIAIPYTDQEIAGKNENNLKIFKFDVGSQTWTELSSTPHPNENYVEANANSFGDKYAVAEVIPPPTQYKLVPENPCWESPLEIRFDMKEDTNVKITISSVIIIEKSTLSKGRYLVKWDIPGNWANGVYTVRMWAGGWYDYRNVFICR